MKKRFLRWVTCLCAVLFFVSAAHAETYWHRDTKYGVKFAIPSGWHQKAFLSPKEVLSAKFVEDENPLHMVMYGAEDLWEQLTPSAKASFGYDRRNMGEDAFTVHEFAVFAGLSDQDVVIRTAGQHRYYLYDAGYMRFFFLIHDGYAYSFQFTSGLMLAEAVILVTVTFE